MIQLCNKRNKSAGKLNTVKPELTTSEQRPPVFNDHHFQVPIQTSIILMISEQWPPVNCYNFFWGKKGGRCAQVWL